jgi:hypothetical protein
MLLVSTEALAGHTSFTRIAFLFTHIHRASYSLPSCIRILPLHSSPHPVYVYFYLLCALPRPHWLCTPRRRRRLRCCTLLRPFIDRIAIRIELLISIVERHSLENSLTYSKRRQHSYHCQRSSQVRARGTPCLHPPQDAIVLILVL